MIGVAIIGYGYWGPNLARCFAQTDGARVAAIADTNPEERERAASRHPAARIFADWQDAIHDPAVDAVAIATPAATHYAIARACLDAGRHVLVEKPITRSSADAHALADGAAARGLTLLAGHTFIYAPPVQAMRRLIVSGELGAVHYYDSTRINLGLFRTDVNVIWDLAVHDIAILRYLLDTSPSSVAATAFRHLPDRPENMAHLTLTYRDAITAHLNVNWLAPFKLRQVLLCGSRRMAVWDDLQTSEKLKVYDRGIATPDPREAQISYRLGDMWAPQLPTTEPLLAQAAHFIDCIRSGATPMTDGRFGADIVAVLEAAERSLRHGGAAMPCGPDAA